MVRGMIMTRNHGDVMAITIMVLITKNSMSMNDINASGIASSIV